MRHSLLILAFLAGALSAADVLAPGTEGQLAIPGCDHPNVLYVPKDYVPGAQMPLILFMHGSGAKPTTWPYKAATGGKGYLIVGLSYGAFPDAGAKGINLGPDGSAAMIAYIDKVRDLVSKTYSVDQKRVILSGLSMGGWGVCAYGFKKELKGRYCGYAILAAGAVDHGFDAAVVKGLPVLVLNGATCFNLQTANNGMPLLENAGAVATQVVLPGEGHVPKGEAMMTALATWLGDMEKMAARGRALAAVTWQRGELAGAQEKAADLNDALGRYLGGQAVIAKADAGKPVLVFCRSSQQGPGGVPSAQAKDTAAVEEAVFSYPTAVGVPAAGRQFTCIDLDLSALEAKANPLLNQTMAPTVVLLGKDRSQIVVLKGKGKLTEAALLAEMRKLLDPTAQAALDARIAATTPILKELQAAQKKQRAKADQVAKLREVPAKDAATRKVKADRIAQEQKALAGIDAEYEALRDKLLAVP